MKNLLAQVGIPIGNIGEGEGFGPFPTQTVITGNAGLDAIIKLVSTAIGFITICSALYFLSQFMIGGFEWMTASGDKSKLSKAQDRMTHSLIGLLIVVATYAIVSILGTVFGIDILLTNPGELIEQLKLI